MRQTEMHLTDEGRELIELYRAKGLHHAEKSIGRIFCPPLIAGYPKPRSGRFSALTNRHLADAERISGGWR